MPSARRSNTRKEAQAAGYRSGFEYTVARSLTERGVEFEYEPKGAIIEYKVDEVRRYLPDFVVGGTRIECKGRLTAADRKKLLLVKKQNPKLDLRLLFQFDNKLSTRSKTRYSAWAEKNGFKWAVGSVPREWLRGR
jgi:hypothetical protein